MDDWIEAFEPQKDEYDRVSLKSKELGEAHDCTVKALAIACDIEYMLAHKTLAQLGRRAGHGCDIRILERAIKTLGFGYKRVAIRQQNGSKYTPVSIERAPLPKGRYICDGHSHVFALVNGIVQDWSNEKHIHINAIYIIHIIEEGI